MSGGALTGLRVVDLAQSSFAYAGKLLAGLGAEVLKVEPPGGDPARAESPFAGDEPHPERSIRYLHFNGGKESVELDLDTTDGGAALLRLVRTADVVLESFPPGYLAQRGLDYERLARERAGLVMASITHYGQNGPYAAYVGSEITATALGGYLMLTGDPDREPVKCYSTLVEQQAALHAAVAVMVGIYRRDETGEGDYFDVSAQDAALFLLGGPAQSHHATGRVVKRRGNRLLFDNPAIFYPSTIRPCSDGYVHVHTNVRHPDLMAVLMEDQRLDAPELREEPLGHADEIDEIMDDWLSRYDRSEIVRRAQELRLPFTEVLTPDEVLADPHLRERGAFVDIDHPLVGQVTQPAAPMILAESPWESGRAPLLNEHADRLKRA